MLTKLIISEPFGKAPTISKICPECGEAQVLKWDSAGEGRNITLSSSSHAECYERYWKNIEEFDYEVTIKESKLKEVA